MKNILFLLIVFSSFSLLAQKSKNGTVYKEHPGLSLIETFNDALVNGDFNKAASLLEDDFKMAKIKRENYSITIGEKSEPCELPRYGLTEMSC